MHSSWNPRKSNTKSGTRINPLEHSELPDAEARVIRNLMERIDLLENKLDEAQKSHGYHNPDTGLEGDKHGKSQNLKDKEIIEYIGDA